MTSPVVTRGVDHAAQARLTRLFGWWFYAEASLRRAIPFIGVDAATMLGNPVLYLTAMGLGLGAIVDQPVDGVRYLTFVAPGLLAATVVTTGANWGTWPIMGGFKWMRNYVAAGATGITAGQIAGGEATSVAVRLFAQSTVFWLVGLLFGAWHSPWSWLMVPIAILGGLAFFAPLASYSATIMDEGIQFNFINRLVIMPMFLFAGTFFPLHVMPPYLQWIGWVSPMWHTTQLARVASYGLPLGAAEVLGHAGFLVACVVGGMLAARHTFTKRLEKES